MKLNFKPLVEHTEQLNVRIPSTLKQRMDHTRAKARELGIDYNATLIANLEEFEREFDVQVSAKQRGASSALAELDHDRSTSASTQLAETHQPNLIGASSNGSQRERA